MTDHVDLIHAVLCVLLAQSLLIAIGLIVWAIV